MSLPDTGVVVANARVAHAAPDQGASHTQCDVAQTPFNVQSKSVEHGVDWLEQSANSAATDSSGARQRVVISRL